MKGLKLPLSILLMTALCITVLGQETDVRKMKLGRKKDKYLFSFVHITDTHIGEGDPDRDYGSPGYFDTLVGNEGGYSAERLKIAVDWINAHQQEEDIKFVLVSGDLTDSGEKSEFLKFKQLMDSLTVPYVPHIGNHDVWPYNRYGTAEAPHASGDSIINEIFKPVYDKLKGTFNWDDGTRTVRWQNPESNTPAYLQNYSFSYMGQRFVFLDFNPRYHVPIAEPGIGPEAQITDYPGGTLPYIRQVLKLAAEEKENVVLISHHPPMKIPFYQKHYAFKRPEKRKLLKAFKQHDVELLGWFAGHIHRWAKYHLWGGGVKVLETKANKAQEAGGFRIVRVYGK